MLKIIEKWVYYLWRSFFPWDRFWLNLLCSVSTPLTSVVRGRGCMVAAFWRPPASKSAAAVAAFLSATKPEKKRPFSCCTDTWRFESPFWAKSYFLLYHNQRSLLRRVSFFPLVYYYFFCHVAAWCVMQWGHTKWPSFFQVCRSLTVHFLFLVPKNIASSYNISVCVSWLSAMCSCLLLIWCEIGNF